jgi:hypothetical protein
MRRLGRIFCASRKKPGYPGLRGPARSGPAALRRGCFRPCGAAPLLSLALLKNGIHAVFSALSFAPQNSWINRSRRPAGPAAPEIGIRADFKL